MKKCYVPQLKGVVGSDILCDIFNGMLENAISSLFLKKQHKLNCKKNIEK